MDSPTGLLLTLLLLILGLALFVFIAIRAVRWARERRGGSEFAGSMGLGSAINPAEALVEERQKAKRRDEDAGDPE